MYATNTSGSSVSMPLETGAWAGHETTPPHKDGVDTEAKVKEEPKERAKKKN